MRQQFDSFRQDLIGRPDAIQSTVTIVPQGDDFVLTVTPVDWQGTALASGVDSVSVVHATGSAQATSIGPVTALGDGRSQTVLTTVGSGLDRFRVTFQDGVRDAGDDPSSDFFLLEYSTDGGASWNPLVSIGDATSNAAWATATTQIPAGSTVELRVQCSDGVGSGDLVECGIDDVSICGH